MMNHSPKPRHGVFVLVHWSVYRKCSITSLPLNFQARILYLYLLRDLYNPYVDVSIWRCSFSAYLRKLTGSDPQCEGIPLRFSSDRQGMCVVKISNGYVLRLEVCGGVFKFSQKKI
jgi:hypothetical protein